MFWAHVESTHSVQQQQTEETKKNHTIATKTKKTKTTYFQMARKWKWGRFQNVLLVVEFINSDVACNLKSASAQFSSGLGFSLRRSNFYEHVACKSRAELAAYSKAFPHPLLISWRQPAGSGLTASFAFSFSVLWFNAQHGHNLNFFIRAWSMFLCTCQANSVYASCARQSKIMPHDDNARKNTKLNTAFGVLFRLFWSSLCVACGMWLAIRSVANGKRQSRWPLAK